MTDYWNTIGKQNPQTDSVHDHLVNCQAERELSSLLRNTAEFRKEVTCPACAAICSSESRGVPGPRDLFFFKLSPKFKTALKVLWEMRGNMWAFKFFWLDQVEDAEAKWHKHQDYKKAGEQRREKMGNTMISWQIPLVLGVSWRWLGTEVLMDAVHAAPVSDERPRGLKPPTPSRQIQDGHLPASSLSWLIWFQLHLTRLNPLIAITFHLPNENLPSRKTCWPAILQWVEALDSTQPSQPMEHAPHDP